jgi:hypothetical protein
MPYHPEEISELYLGARQSDAFKAEIVKLAQTANPAIKVYDAAHDKASPGRISSSTSDPTDRDAPGAECCQTMACVRKRTRATDQLFAEGSSSAGLPREIRVVPTGEWSTR